MLIGFALLRYGSRGVHSLGLLITRTGEGIIVCRVFRVDEMGEGNAEGELWGWGVQLCVWMFIRFYYRHVGMCNFFCMIN